jgi:hypothetical protein
MELQPHQWSKKLEEEAAASEGREAAKKHPALPPSAAVEPLDWERITPPPLIPALTHIRDSFDTAVWKWRKVTQKFCYAALHPKEVNAATLAPYQDTFNTYRRIFGSDAIKRFNDLCQAGTAPALFQAFFEILVSGLKVEVRKVLGEFLKVGRTNTATLSSHPEWAKSHVLSLIRSEEHTVKRWIKEVCDEQDISSDPETEEEVDELISWKSWRAPRLIHMKPSGNTPYDQATEWLREDEQRTQHLLASLSKRLLGFLEIDLNHTVGKAHVGLAKNQETAAVPKPETQHFIKTAQRAPKVEQVGCSAAVSWAEIKIHFLSEERVQINASTTTMTLNYAEFGFEDSRSGKPKRAWIVFRILAEKQGIIRSSSEASLSWPKVEKRIQEIRKILRSYFGIYQDPIPFIEGTGYQARFKIACRPSYHN